MHSCGFVSFTRAQLLGKKSLQNDVKAFASKLPYSLLRLNLTSRKWLFLSQSTTLAAFCWSYLLKTKEKRLEVLGKNCVHCIATCVSASKESQWTNRPRTFRFWVVYISRVKVSIKRTSKAKIVETLGSIDIIIDHTVKTKWWWEGTL